MKKFWLLAISYWLLAVLPADAATPTPKTGDVGVKAEVKVSTPAAQSQAPQVSTGSAAQTIQEQPTEGAKKDKATQEAIPKPEIKEQPKAPVGLIGEALIQVDDLLTKDNSWLNLLILLWIVFIAVITFLILRLRRKKKLEVKNVQAVAQTPAESPPANSPRETAPPETEFSS